MERQTLTPQPDSGTSLLNVGHLGFSSGRGGSPCPFYAAKLAAAATLIVSTAQALEKGSSRAVLIPDLGFAARECRWKNPFLHRPGTCSAWHIWGTGRENLVAQAHAQ